jgi:hypothetical protein
MRSVFLSVFNYKNNNIIRIIIVCITKYSRNVQATIEYRFQVDSILRLLSKLAFLEKLSRVTGCCLAVELVDHSAYKCSCFSSSSSIMLTGLNITSICVGCMSCWLHLMDNIKISRIGRKFCPASTSFTQFSDDTCLVCFVLHILGFDTLQYFSSMQCESIQCILKDISIY